MSDDESDSDWHHPASAVCWHETLLDAVGRVSAALGPGLTESIYQHALAVELRGHNTVVEVEKIFEIKYRDQSVGFVRADLVVDGHAVIELKTVAKITDAHVTQLDAYMRQLTKRPRTGAVVNFNIHGGVEIKTLERMINWGVPRISDARVGD
jgi:GxxExxY protein